MAKQTQNELAQGVANKILALMEEHGTDWQKPWTSTAIASGLPSNVASKKAYQGINTLLLAMEAMDKGYTSSVWGTLKQWNAAGGKVIKGQKSTVVFFWKPLLIDEKDASGKVIKDAEGNKKQKKIFMLKTYNIFNKDQVEGLADEPVVPVSADPEFYADEVEAFINNTGAVVKHGGGQAYYRPATDHIQMPAKADFQGTDTSSAEECYYSTLLHELVHWTGSNGRIDRTKGKMFGDKDYAFEELVAETGSAILSVQLGVSVEPRADHAKYLNSWKKALTDNPKAIFSAFTQAYKAVDFLNDLQPETSEEVAA